MKVLFVIKQYIWPVKCTHMFWTKFIEEYLTLKPQQIHIPHKLIRLCVAYLQGFLPNLCTLSDLHLPLKPETEPINHTRGVGCLYSYQVLSRLLLLKLWVKISHRREIFRGPDSGINLSSFLAKSDNGEKTMPNLKKRFLVCHFKTEKSFIYVSKDKILRLKKFQAFIQAQYTAFWKWTLHLDFRWRGEEAVGECRSRQMLFACHWWEMEFVCVCKCEKYFACNLAAGLWSFFFPLSFFRSLSSSALFPFCLFPHLC